MQGLRGVRIEQGRAVRVQVVGAELSHADPGAKSLGRTLLPDAFWILESVDHSGRRSPRKIRVMVETCKPAFFAKSVAVRSLRVRYSDSFMGQTCHSGNPFASPNLP